MAVENLRRAVARIIEWGKEHRCMEHDLRRAIMIECGTDPKTIWQNKRVMIELGMIKRFQKNTYRVLDGDPT